VREMLIVGCLAVLAGRVLADEPVAESPRWPVEKARTWYETQGWRVGCNFIPSTAVNQLEMWQEATFDPTTTDRELGWAADMGMNAVRVYLHDLAWEAGAEGFRQRVRRFLDIAHRHGIKTMFVLFDDCWNESPRLGPQPAPIPGVHNSGWLQGPGKAVVNDPAQWERLERYAEGIVGAFAQDDRILAWDLYNEPGNSGQGAKSLPLLKKAFAWARKADPSQPLTVGVWDPNLRALNDFQLEASDVITFHNYGDAEGLARQIADLDKHGRPILCTEWLRRGHSDVETHLPIFKKERVGCFNWGLVAGKTQTIYPWGSPKDAPEPEQWFHDLLRQDGTPFDEQETALFRQLTGNPEPRGQ